MPIQLSLLVTNALRYAGCHERLLSHSVSWQKKISRYKACFGQLPYVHAKIWLRLRNIDKERNQERFFMTLFFFKTYPTESVLAVRFGIDEETVRSWIWYYAEALAMLKEDLIKMPESFPDNIHFPCVVDGTHCLIFEPAHDLFPLDTDHYGHKRNTAAYNYQIALSSFESKLYRVDGPYPAGKFNDAKAFVASGLQEQMVSQGKRAIADGGYDGTEGTITPDRRYHTKLTNMYLRRNRARVERTMAFFKNYGILSGTFRIRKNRVERHRTVMNAIAVLVQTAMTTTTPVFSA